MSPKTEKKCIPMSFEFNKTVKLVMGRITINDHGVCYNRTNKKKNEEEKMEQN